MFISYVLVKNLVSDCNELSFVNFILKKIQHDDDDTFEEAKKLFPGGRPDYDDWIYKRCYNAINDWWEVIPNDIEETLFFFRLFKVGDLCFLQPTIHKSDGALRQLPYRIMSDIVPFRDYEFQAKECSQFDNFVSEIKSKHGWRTTWFQTARRFFLYGGSKEFNPRFNEIDRIVDNMIAMESILVPEGDFIGRRLRERACLLLKNPNIDCSHAKTLISKFYGIRSKIVHGDDAHPSLVKITDNQIIEFENIVRLVIKEALKSLPTDTYDRKQFLKRLFDICDRARGDNILEDFRAIKDINEKKRCFDGISKLMQKLSPKTEN